MRHPIAGVSALDVSMKLAKELGVVTLPASFFGLGGPSPESGEGSGVTASIGDEDKWIRFSIANVNDESLEKVRERLLECEQSFRSSN